VNFAVGGAKRSAHLSGRAADIIPLRGHARGEGPSGKNTLSVMQLLKESEIPFDKAIFEFRGNKPWIHIQVCRVGRDPRRGMLMSLEAGQFERFDLDDERLRRWKDE
jgi:hypothetical protein